MYRHMTTSFSWLHRTIYGRKHKCHVQLFRIKTRNRNTWKYMHVFGFITEHDCSELWESCYIYHVTFTAWFYWPVQMWHGNRTSTNTLQRTKYPKTIKELQICRQKGQIRSRSLFVKFKIRKREFFVLRWSKAKRHKRRISKWLCVAGKWNKNGLISYTMIYYFKSLCSLIDRWSSVEQIDEIKVLTNL